MSLGLVLKKVYRVLEFQQKPWLKPYINFNTEKRTEASKSKNKFLKDFFKLMNNSVFGKTMENVRNRIDFELVCDSKRASKISSDPRFESSIIIREQSENQDGEIIDDGLIGMKRIKNKIKLNKPVYAGLSVLDLSKLTMYKFHYGYMKPKYSDKCKLLFTDTDSLCYHIETEDIYKDMEENKHLFDLSNYDQKHWLYDDTNESVLEKFKDETEGIPIKEFCGIRAKQYSYILKDDDHKLTCKGIKTSAMKRISHQNYYDCLFGNVKKQYISFNSFRSKNQTVSTIELNKTSLSPYDDKRYIYDGINSYSYGHYKISK